MSLQVKQTTTTEKRRLNSQGLLKGVLIAFFFVTISVVIIELEFFTSQVAQLQVGDISPQDIIVSAAISYESQISTERARDQAAQLESIVFSQPDRNVAHQQRVVANQIFNYLDSVRVDPYLTSSQKLTYLEAIEAISVSVDEAEKILSLNEGLWTQAKQEIDSILGRVMQDDIKESDLPSARVRLNLFIPDVPEQEADVILVITEDLVQPNSYVDEVRTEERRLKAREAVQPIIVTYEENEVVVRAGERVTALDIEALAKMGLHQSRKSWRDYLASFLWFSLLVAGVIYYLLKNHPKILYDNQRLQVLFFVPLIFMIMIRVMVPGQTVLAYALPMAALTIILAGALNPRVAFVVTTMMGLVVGYVANGSFELTAYVIVMGLVVVLNVSQLAQVYTLLWAGLYASVSNVVLILMFRLLRDDLIVFSTDQLLTLLAQIGNGILSGIVSSGLAVLGVLIIGNVTGLVTHLQLIELSRPTQPLLSELLRRAPGTYHHTLVVSNLAEQAATRIGANAFLCRVGAYYHDIGKMVRPYFFTENARPGVNLHDNLDPETSAQIIISHVTEGLRLAKENGIPEILQSFIAEHHGTEIAGFSFYHQAVNDADGDEDQVDRSRFSYPGPKPQTKETAILMLADASEATVRAVQPESAQEINQLVRTTIAKRMESGQFDECDLTLRDIEQIRLAFNEVLQGVAHQRVKYPKADKGEVEPTEATLPSLPLTINEGVIKDG